MRVLLLLLLLAGAVSAKTLEQRIESREYEQVLVTLAKELPRTAGAARTRLLVLKADCEVQLKRLDAAEETLAQVKVSSAPPRFFRVRGELNAQRKAADLAGKDFRLVLTLEAEPRDRILAACGLAELEEDPQKAQGWWARSVQEAQRPGTPTSAWLLIYRCRLDLLLKSGRQEEALSEARLARAHMEALKSAGGATGMLLYEAFILKDLDRFPEAEAAWSRALEGEASRYSGGILAVWGYNVMMGRDDPAALRRFLAAAERHWSESWPAYERYHLRLLQGLICLRGLNEPRQALRYLALAEQLAVPGRRPSGNFMTVNMRFHLFSSEPHSELEQVLWLELQAHRKLGDVRAFMEGKLPRLSAAERPPWLYTLGKEYLQARAPEKAAALFAQALEGPVGVDRTRLLKAMLEVYLETGRLQEARRLLDPLAQSLSVLKGDEVIEITGGFLTLWEPWGQPLWLGSVEPTGESPQIAFVDGLLARAGLRERYEKATRQKLETHLRALDPVALARDYASLARQLALESRLAEAVVACERSREYAGKAHLVGRQAEADRLLSYLLFRLGDRGPALERIRSARAAFTSMTTMDGAEEAATCASLEAAFLLELQRPREALELLEQYPAGPAQEYGRARACLLLDRPAEALAALERCEPGVEGTLHAVAVRTLRAIVYRHQGLPAEALRELGRAYELGRELNTLKVRELALLWHEWEPATAPVKEAADAVDRLLAHAPAGFADKVRQRPATRQLLTLAGRAPPEPAPQQGWLTRAEFLREAGGLLKQHPDLATSVPLLPASLAQKAETLGDEVLVEYYLGARELVIMLAAREGLLTRTLAVERSAIEERVARVRRQLTGGAGDAAAASELARVLVEPVAERIGGRPVVFLAHGPLLALPWDLLPGPPLNWSLWAGEALTRYGAGPPTVLALGNVTGVDLPGSAREVELVGRLLPGQVLTGPAATATGLREGLPAAGVVHFATHSQPTHLQLSDGPLRLEEIYSLPLRPGALVVLSSCEGAAAEGQERGPVTLASAFLAAGASQVVASLTPVVDEEAERLFGEFYRNLARGLAPGAALRDAKAERRQAGGRADWAAFVLLGGL